MSDVIFLRHQSGLLRLVRTVPEREDPFQQLLEEHPELLGGSQLRPDGEPLRFLLVQREAGIKDGDDRGNRWSIDHVFIDQHGVPTLVEVKRSTDTRVRREVVGQLLEYAANATAWWKAGHLEHMARELYGDRYDDVLHTFLDGEAPSEFWQSADDRLSGGRIRLLFVADRIPSELRTLIEFLDDKLDGIEVAGVEVVHYAHGDNEAYVPRVVAQSERARTRREQSAPKSRINEAQFLARVGPSAASVFSTVFAEARERNWTVYFGTDGFSVRVPTTNGLRTVFYGYPSGALGYEKPSFQVTRGNLPEQFQAALADVLDPIGFERTGTATYHMPAADTDRDGLRALLSWAEAVSRSLRADTDHGDPTRRARTP